MKIFYLVKNICLSDPDSELLSPPRVGRVGGAAGPQRGAAVSCRVGLRRHGDCGPQRGGAGQRAGAGRPRTAFQALNSRFSLVLAELRQVHLRTMKPASLPPLLDTGHTGDRWILYISS